MIKVQARYTSLDQAMPWFLTRTAFAATVCPQALKVARVAGLSVPGDLGRDAVYKRVAGLPAYGAGWFRSLDRFMPDESVSEANGGYWQYDPTNDVIDLGHLGWVEGEAAALANRTIARAATDMGAARGGGKIHVPKGTFYADNPNPASSDQVFLLTSGLSVGGVGWGVSTVKIVAGSNMHVVNLSGQERIEISKLTLDQGHDHTLGVHTIRIGDFGGRMLIFRDLELINPRHYGIALQGSLGGDGVNSYIVSENVRITRPGFDGVDIKDRAGSNLAMYFDKMTVEEPGYLQTSGGGDNSVGIDLRGIVMLSNCNVLNIKAVTGNAADGIRVRPPSSSDPTHLGGKRSQITNCYVSGVASAGRTTGFNILDDDVGGSNLHTEGPLWRPFHLDGDNIKLTNIGGKDFVDAGVVFGDNCRSPRITQANMDSTAPGDTIGFAAAAGAQDVRLFSIGSDGTNRAFLALAGSTGRIEGTPDFTNNTTATIDDQTTLGSWKIGFDATSSSVATVASAATLNIRHKGAVVTVTGTTNISAITLAEGCWAQLKFADVLTVTHGASLILPAAANVITAANDSMLVLGEAAGVVRCLDWRPKDEGKVQFANVASGSAVSLTTTVAADVASVSISAAGTYEITGQVAFQGAASVSVTDLAGWLNATSATMPDGSTLAAPLARPLLQATGVVPGSDPFVMSLAQGILTVGTSPVTLYLGARAVFTVGTLAAYGYLSARRIR